MQLYSLMYNYLDIILSVITTIDMIMMIYYVFDLLSMYINISISIILYVFIL